MRLTLSEADATIARVLGVCAGDARVATYANEAHQRLLTKGKWLGSYQLIRLCVTDENCLTWPRGVETIEAFALCRVPGKIQNQWFEFLDNGPGVQLEDSQPGNILIDRGDGFVTFEDITPTGKKLRAQAAVSEAAGARILLQGYDDNNQWIRTQDAGTWIDGEYMSISTVMQTSVNNFASLQRVVKPITNGNVNVWEYNSTSGATVLLATYEPDETLPCYRRSIMPGLSLQSSCCDDAACKDKTVHAIVKLRHIPVRNTNDFFVLGNIGALKLMVMAILKEERNLFMEARAYEAQATQILQDELATHLGDGAIHHARYERVELWGGGGVENYV